MKYRSFLNWLLKYDFLRLVLNNYQFLIQSGLKNESDSLLYNCCNYFVGSHKIWKMPDYNFMVEDKNKRNPRKQIAFNVIQSIPR